MSDRLVSVAVPVPALGLLTYSVPSDQDMPVPGARVIVPLGPRRLTGVVVGHVGAVDVAFKMKDIVQVLDADAFVPPDVVKLTAWVSEYYLAGPGATLSAALPPHGLANRVDRFKTVRVAALTGGTVDEPRSTAISAPGPYETVAPAVDATVRLAAPVSAGFHRS